MRWWFFTAHNAFTEELEAAAVISAPDEGKALKAARKMGTRSTMRNRVESLPDDMLAIVPPQWTNRLLTPDEVAWTALWNDAERQRFEYEYAARSGVTVAELHSWGRYAEPCSCDDEWCEGWNLGHQHDDALFESDLYPDWMLA